MTAWFPIQILFMFLKMGIFKPLRCLEGCLWWLSFKVWGGFVWLVGWVFLQRGEAYAYFGILYSVVKEHNFESFCESFLFSSPASCLKSKNWTYIFLVVFFSLPTQYCSDDFFFFQIWKREKWWKVQQREITSILFRLATLTGNKVGLK